MNFSTHLIMGETLYGELCRVEDLDRESFIFGNVKPDCSLEFILKPHTLTNYLDQVSALADSLIEEDLTKEDYSENLGVLCHLLSDFCCLYHAKEDMFNRLLGHMIYEIRLHKLHKKMESSFLKNVFSSKTELSQNIKQTVLSSREEYFSQPHSLEMDFVYAYRLCKQVCQSVAYYRSGEFVYNQAAYYEQRAYVMAGGAGAR